MNPKTFDKAKLPDWMLVEENEKLQVAALSLSKTTTRDEWVARLQQFSDLLAPGFTIVSTEGTQRAAWKPLAARQMPPHLQPNLTTHGATFTINFIQNELRGIEWSPGFFFIHPKDRRDGSKLTAYWILDADLDPYLPKQPGEHGAKLTPFFNSTMSGPGEAPSEEDYINTPVFIGNNYRNEYRYFGHYSQTRFSDKLDYERIVDGTVPPFVLDVWAKVLTQPDLYSWTKDELRQHIWPKPTYHGPLPLGSPSGSPGSAESRSPVQDSHAHDRRVKKAIQRYSEDLQAWEIDSKLRLSMLKEADIHRLFRAADSDEQVGLRLWFEYLQCTSYEHEFYERMVELKYNEYQQRGYQEKIDGLMRQGWRWQLVETTTGSGHTAMAQKLCPPPAKAKVSAARKDSVVGSEQSLPPPKSRQPEKEVTKTLDAAEQRPMGDKTSSSSHTKTALSPPQQQALPLHLRGKTSKPAEKTDEPKRTTTLTETKAPTTAEPSRTNRFSLGDLEEAKRMQSTFTRAGCRRNGDSNFPGGHSNNAQQMLDRHNPLNQGWARAGRNPKPVLIDSVKDVLW